MKLHDIEGWEGMYSVDKEGNIFSHRSNIYLKEEIDKDGYHRIRLCKHQKKFRYNRHRLVALTFIDNPKNKAEVNHKDGNKNNNNVENLEWVTRQENSLHSTRVLKKNVGESHGNTKLKVKDVIKIKELLQEYTPKQVSDKLNLKYHLVYDIKRGKTWVAV